MQGGMSDATDIAESNRGGRFVNGGKPGPGRPRGARSRLGSAFLEDLSSVWETHGKQALIDCAENEPSQFVRVLAGLMPRDVNINATLGVTTFATNFRHALEMLGNEPALPRRKAMKVIDAG
jgi:hypothetical protein